jgi:hypothetical protein
MGESAGCNDGAASGKAASYDWVRPAVEVCPRWMFPFEPPDKHGRRPLRGTSPPRRVELVVVQGERRALDGVGDRHNPQLIAQVGEPAAIARQRQELLGERDHRTWTVSTTPANVDVA